MHSHINFGYPWAISYGHLVLALILLLLFSIGWKRRWPKLLLILTGLAVIWSFAAFIVTRFVMDINGRATLPTQAFLPSGSGEVLDMGAGTGRSTLMVLESRPGTRVVALDLFGAEYVQHFGASDPNSTLDVGRARLLRNLEAAGVSQRATVQPGDMRQLPFGDGRFDAIVSSYAIDHLNREGRQRALSEANRVLKPGGQFLLMVIAKEPWLTFTFGPLLLHSLGTGPDFWPNQVKTAGFQIQEQGTRPATLYMLARK